MRLTLYRIGAALFCLLVIFTLSLKIYLATPYSAPQLSRMLTSYLHQTVIVSSLRSKGDTIYLMGLSLANPTGFPAGNLATADSIAIAPQWGKLLLGKKGLRLLALEGVRIDVRKNSTGTWNYSGLQQAFASKKPATSETFIKQLVIKGASLQVNGQGVQGISLRLFNLATLGSDESKIELAFEDAARNHYAISGKARPGKEPGFDLALSAPSLALSAFAKTLPLKYAEVLEQGRANLQLNAGLQWGQLRVTGTLGFNGISLSIAKKTLPLTGILSVKADYNLHNDQVHMETMNLNVNNLLRLYLTGTARNLRRERSFSAKIAMDEVDLAALAHLLPENEQRRTLLGGTLGNTEINLSGSAVQGITSASGSLLLHDASLSRDGRTFFSGLDSTIRLAKVNSGILVNGHLSLGKTHGKPILEALNAPFTVNLSPRLQLLAADIPSLSARVMGIPVMGRLGFSAAASNPLAATLRIPATKVSALQPLLDRFDLHLTSGIGALSLDAAGQGMQDFSATASVQLAALQGQKGKTTFAMKHGTADSRMSWSRQRLVAAGKVQASGLATGGKAGEARFSYSFADGTAIVDNAALRLDKASATIARLVARIPVQESRQGTVRYPLFLEVTGAEVHQGELMLGGLSASVRGVYAAALGARWLEGTADASSGQVSWQGKPVGSPGAHITFTPSGAQVNLKGPLLGGELLGEIFLNPFTLDGGGRRFTLGVKKIQLARAGDLIPDQKTITLAEGLLDASTRGEYTGKKGLDCVFETRGSGITLRGKANKNLLTGAGVRLAGNLSGNTVAIREALFTAGEGVSLTATGEIANVLSTQRKGALSIILPQTPLNSIIDPFVNVLPPFLQEAVVDGSLAAEATVELHDNKKLLHGALALKGGRLEVPSQKMTATDINGSLPFSLDLSGGAKLLADDGTDFSRENFPALLKQLQKPGGGQSFSVGKISFGPLDLGALTLHVKAGNGITEITSLRSSFSEGDVLGKGFIAFKEGINYRGDFLIHNLSMIQLCNRFPAIKGYVSGRLDGIISLYGQKKGLEGLTGFTGLWAREGSGEKMLVSKEFLQRLSGKKLRGFFFRSDRPFDQAEINATLEEGYLTFETLNIEHTNLFGVRDLSVSIAPSQNRIALDPLLNTIKQAAARGKAATGEDSPAAPPSTPEFKWEE